MKLFHLALKDIRRQFRSRFALVFMFVVPVLITAIFYVMFGGGAGEAEFTLPLQQVVVVNLDEGHLTGRPVDNLGALLIQTLQEPALADLLAVESVPTDGAARAAVDTGEAAVAIIIPAGFTEAVTGAGASPAVVDLYADPTLTLGPQVVEGIVSSIVAQMAAARIGTGVALERIAASGITVDSRLIDQVLSEFVASTENAAAPDSTPLLVIEAPPGTAVAENPLTRILGLIMGGMMVFYVFFTAAVSMQSILTEEEGGTLPRLFMTPTSPRVIFASKALAALLILVVQVTVLLAFGRLVFGIHWGGLPSLSLAVPALILSAAATGLFLISLLKNSRQAGVVFGGVLTMTSMLGMITVFTAGSSSPATQTASLFVPQGWAVRALQVSMEGATVGEIVPLALGLLAWTLVLGAVGTARLSRRYA